MWLKQLSWLSIICLAMISCSTSREASKELLLNHVEIVAPEGDVNVGKLDAYVRQRPLMRMFVFKKSVPFDSLAALQTCNDLLRALQNEGYVRANVSLDTTVIGRKVSARYVVMPGERFHIANVAYDVTDEGLARFLHFDEGEQRELKEGVPFSIDGLNNERNRLTSLLTDQGFFRFNKDFIRYTVDSMPGSRLVDVTLHILPYRRSNDDQPKAHQIYRIGRVDFLPDDDGRIRLRRSVLEENTLIESGDVYSASRLQKTYKNFGRLGAVRYTNIQFKERKDTALLDCEIQVSTGKTHSLSFQPEGTNTSGDLGAAASLTYENRNVFRGSETFSLQLRGAYEAITGLEGYQSRDYMEYSVEGKLIFPRLLMPIISQNFRRKSTASSELSVSTNMQDRPEFHRRLFSAAWRYRWSDAHDHINYRADVLDLNYIHMPWISPTFKREYLDDVNTRNAILRYNYEDLMIMKIGFSLAYSYGNEAMRANMETAGNLLNGFSRLSGSKRNERGQYTVFNTAYAQYVKGDFEYTHLYSLGQRCHLALHSRLGIAWPYGNSRVLPFEKRYFSGGANSVRGWSVRTLGPGRFKRSKGAIDFINQTGDLRLDLNAELRAPLFWKLSGAFFVDAGNIWTLRSYEDQPGGQFHLDEFYEQIAVAYGIGVRLNFDYFILRFDLGMKALNPAFDSSDEHYALLHPRFSRDFAFHFAVGLPF